MSDPARSTIPETTVAVLLDEACRLFAGAGIQQPRGEARWLLSRVLGLSASQLLGHPELGIGPEGATAFREAVRRRAAREPFAYVVGEREFYGRSFVVDRRVLVPRSETELLIAETLTVLAGPPAEHPDRPLVVDAGAGSGAIACTLALEAPDARVIGCDVSADALSVAAINRERLGLCGRLVLVRGSLLDWLGQPADLVVANLPYIPRARVPTLMPEVAHWEPHLALDGGPDGLALIRQLLADARRAVRPGGTILLEMDPEQIGPARALLPNASARVTRDLAGLDRVLRLDLPS